MALSTIQREILHDKMMLNGKAAIALCFVLYISLLCCGGTSYAYFSLLSGLLVLLNFYLSRFDSSLLNLLTLIGYVLLLGVEYYLHGIPSAGIDISSGAVKGIVLDMVVGIVPYVYGGLRLGGALLLLGLPFVSYRFMRD